MNEVTDGNSAGDGPTNPSSALDALRARARRERAHLAETQAAHNERVARLNEEHAAWEEAQRHLCEEIERQAGALGERERSGEEVHGIHPSQAEVRL